MPVEWFALSAGAKIAMDSGTENMDWVAAALRRIIEFTQARRRDQRRRHRHQRRRAAVLERRGDDADAHPGHPRDDAGERDGAHRQAGARLLRAACRPRTTSASAATTASWAPTARRSTGRPTSRARARMLLALLRAHLRRAGRALPAPRADAPTRVERDVRDVAAQRAGSDAARPSATIFSDDDEPGPQAAVRHPLGDARGGRRRPPAAGALGGHARRRDRGRVGRAPGRLAGVPASASSRTRSPRFGAGARRRPGPVDLRHAVPALLARRSRGRSTRVGGRRAVVVLANLAGFDGSPESMRELAARVRRGDRPRGRQLRRADRVLRRLPLPRRRVRGVLAAPQRRARDGRASRARTRR